MNGLDGNDMISSPCGRTFPRVSVASGMRGPPGWLEEALLDGHGPLQCPQPAKAMDRLGCHPRRVRRSYVRKGLALDRIHWRLSRRVESVWTWSVTCRTSRGHGWKRPVSAPPRATAWRRAAGRGSQWQPRKGQGRGLETATPNERLITDNRPTPLAPPAQSRRSPAAH